MRKYILLSMAIIGMAACKKQDNGSPAGGNSNNQNTTPPQIWASDNTLSVSDTAFIKVIVQPDGKLLVADRTQVKRLNKDGSTDNSFTAGTVTNGGLIKTVALQSDGKIWVAGNFYIYNGVTRNLMVRLNANGSIDNTAPNLVNLLANDGDPGVMAILVMTDGSILVGGNFFYNIGPVNNVFANGVNNLIHLTSQGTFDSNFSTFQVIGTVKCFTYDNNGKILIGGTSLYAHDSGLNNYYNILRVSTNGILDPTFRINTGGLTLGTTDIVVNKSSVNALFVQDDGKILAAGYFDAAGKDKKYASIVRFNTNSTLDNSFTPAKNFGDVTSIYRASDKRIFIGAAYNTNEAVSVLKDDGSIDNTVTLNFPHFGNVYNILPDADGNLLITGRLNNSATEPMTSAKAIIRVNKQ